MMMMADACVRCGTPTCDDDLCDVHITEPAEIKFHPYQLLHADIVRKALGIDGDAPLDGETAVRFMSALLKAYDATQTVNLEGMFTDYDDVSRVTAWRRRKEEGYDSTYWKATKERLQAYLQAGGSILDDEEEVGIPYADRTRALSWPYPSRLMLFSPEDWAELEAVMKVDVGRPSCLQLAAHYEVKPGVIRSLFKMYGHTDYFTLPTPHKGDAAARRKAWRDRNPEKVRAAERARSARRYEANKEEMNANRRARTAANRAAEQGDN